MDTKFLPILNCIDDIIVDQYTASKSEIIGEGGFGIVIRGIRADRSQKYVAFKIELAKRSHIPHELEALHTLNAHSKLACLTYFNLFGQFSCYTLTSLSNSKG